MPLHDLQPDETLLQSFSTTVFLRWPYRIHLFLQYCRRDHKDQLAFHVPLDSDLNLFYKKCLVNRIKSYELNLPSWTMHHLQISVEFVSIKWCIRPFVFLSCTICKWSIKVHTIWWVVCIHLDDLEAHQCAQTSSLFEMKLECNHFSKAWIMGQELNTSQALSALNWRIMIASPNRKAYPVGVLVHW